MADTNQRGCCFQGAIVRNCEGWGVNKKASYTRARARTPRKNPYTLPFYITTLAYCQAKKGVFFFGTISMLQPADT